MRAWFYKHRALVGYVVIVLVAVALVEAQAIKTTRELNRHDDRSCEQRNKLADNQRAVLGSLIHILSIEINEASHGNRAGSRFVLIERLRDLNRRLISAGPEAC